MLFSTRPSRFPIKHVARSSAAAFSVFFGISAIAHGATVKIENSQNWQSLFDTPTAATINDDGTATLIKALKIKGRIATIRLTKEEVGRAKNLVKEGKNPTTFIASLISKALREAIAEDVKIKYVDPVGDEPSLSAEAQHVNKTPPLTGPRGVSQRPLTIDPFEVARYGSAPSLGLGAAKKGTIDPVAAAAEALETAHSDSDARNALRGMNDETRISVVSELSPATRGSLAGALSPKTRAELGIQTVWEALKPPIMITAFIDPNANAMGFKMNSVVKVLLTESEIRYFLDNINSRSAISAILEKIKTAIASAFNEEREQLPPPIRKDRDSPVTSAEMVMRDIEPASLELPAREIVKRLNKDAARGLEQKFWTLEFEYDHKKYSFTLTFKEMHGKNRKEILEIVRQKIYGVLDALPHESRIAIAARVRDSFSGEVNSQLLPNVKETELKINMLKGK